MKKSIAVMARELTEAPLAAAGFSLWDVRFEKCEGDFTLTFEVDKGGVMSMEDCEKANAIIEPLTDGADLINGPYVLEVSSAGITRTLKTDAHYEAALRAGWETRLRLFAPLNGSKEYSGKIEAFDSESVTVSGVTLTRKSIAAATANL